MPDVKGGRIVIPVEGDTSGFREEAQARLDAAAAGIRVTVPLEVDSHLLRERVEAAARIASAGQEVRLGADVDTELIRTKLDAAAAAAELGQMVHVGVELHDDAVERLRREVAVADRLAGLGQDVHVGVDRGGAANDVEQAASGAAGGVAAAGQEAASAASGFSMFGMSGMAAAVAAGVLTGGITALIGVLGALAGGLAPVLGGLAALPGAFAVGGVAIGTLFAGLSGIGKAAGALGKQQETAGTSARQYADQQRAAAERVRLARQTLANTEYDVARQRITDAHSVASSEYDLQQAELASTQATKDLTAARRDAARQLEDLKNQAADAALAAQGAQLDLEQARQQYIEVFNDPNATVLQREQAQLALDEAKQRLKEAQTDASRARDDNARAQKAGVEGSQQVQSAVQSVADAHHRVSEAIFAEGQAQEQQSHDAVLAQQRIYDAQQQVLDSLRAQAAAEAQVGAGASAVQQAMEGLTPTARKFAEFLHGVIEGPLKRLRQIGQESLLPGLQAGLEKIAGPNGLWPQLDRLIANTGRALGSFFDKLGTAMAGPRFRGILDSLATAMPKIVGPLGDAAINIGSAMGTLLKASLPLLESFARGLDRITGGWDRSLKAAEKSGELKSFFDAVGTAVHQWGKIVGNVIGVIFGLLRAAWPAGKQLNDSLVTTTGNWLKWVNSAKGQNAIKKFFEDAVPVAKALGHFIEALAGAIIKIATNKAWTSFLNTLTKVVPPLAKFAAAFGGALATEIAAVVKIVGGLVGGLGPLSALLGPVALGLFNAVVVLKGFKAVRGFVNDVKDFYNAFEKGLGKMKKAVGAVVDFIREGKLAAAATKVWTGIQAAFNLVMDANPLILIAVAVVALGIAIYEAYKHFKPFRDAVDAVGRALKKVFEAAVRDVVKAFHWLTGHVDDVVNFFKKLPGRVVSAITALPGKVLDVLEKLGSLALKAVRMYIDLWVDVYIKFPLRVIKAVWHLIEDIAKFFASVFTHGLHAVEDGVKAVVSFVAGLPGKVIDAARSLHDMLHQLLVDVWHHALDAVTSGVGDVVDFVKGLPGKIIDALSNLGSELWNTGKDIITGLLNGIENGVGDIGAWVKHNIVDKFLDSLKHGFGLWSPSRVMRGHGRDVIAGFLLGLTDDNEHLRQVATSVVDKVVDAMSSRVGKARELGKGLVTYLQQHLNTDELMGAYTAGHPVLSQLIAHAQQQAVVYQTGINPYMSQQMAGEFGIGVRDIIVHNPVPEPASASVSSQLRRRRVLKTPARPPANTRRAS